MRTVRNSARMKRDRRRLDSLARSEIAAHVKQNLVCLDVVVHPRNFHRLGMGIEQTRCEGADNIAANLKRLMNRRRLVHCPGDWLEILSVEREWINVAVPAHDIEWMMRHRHAGPARSVFHQDL